MSEEQPVPLTEDARRYYLNAMGIQCWQLLENDGEQTTDSSNIAASFKSLETDIEQCKKCSLHGTRKQAITGRGNPSADLLFVLLSPSQDDDDSGVLCDGEAGGLFRKMLAAIDILIDDVYITSLLKCAVPETHTVSMTDIFHCQEYLRQQIDLVRPRLIVVLGDTAARCLLQKDVSLDSLRDEINVKPGDSPYCYESIPLAVSYSPMELLQNTNDKRKAWSDLQRIQKLIEASLEHNS